LVGVGAVLGAVAIVVVAVRDHDDKTRRMGPASVAEWECTHRGIHCDEEPATSIEEHWIQRERAYKAGLAGCVALAGGAAFMVIRRRRR
jgi:hypothetical protein